MVWKLRKQVELTWYRNYENQGELTWCVNYENQAELTLACRTHKISRSSGLNIIHRLTPWLPAALPATKQHRRKLAGKNNPKKKLTTGSVRRKKTYKQVHPDTNVSTKALRIINIFVSEIFERIAGEVASSSNQSW